MSTFCLHDLNLFAKLPYYIPNLEMMKMYEYYIKYRDLVVISNNIEPDLYTKTYIFKDIEDHKPIYYINKSNVQYYGKCFITTYKPFPDELENIQPSFIPLLKNKSLKDYNKINPNFKAICKSINNRLSVDGENIRTANLNAIFDALTQSKTVIFHDYDLGKIKGIKDVTDEIFKLSLQKNITVGNKFPIQCYDTQTFLEWITFGPSKKYGSIQYNGILPNEVIQEMCTRKGALCSSIIYNIGYHNKSFNDFFKTDLLLIYKQIMLLRSYKIRILLEYTDDYNLPLEFKHLLNLLNIFIVSGTNNNTVFHEQSTMIYFIQWIKTHQDSILMTINHIREAVLSIADIKEVFRYVQKNNYELFKLFYECGEVIYKGGEIVQI